MSTPIENIRAALAEVGGVSVPMPDGKQLYLVHGRNIGREEGGVLVAYEGQGVAWFSLDRPFTTFQLVGQGFSLRIAPPLALLLNEILRPSEQPETQPLLT